MGELLHGTFENYASDENLPPEHWFWDRVEERWHLHRARRALLRPLRRLAGSRDTSPPPRVGIRPGSDPPIEEHVQCTVRYAPDILVNFYHGFHQTGRMDRQELRLVFERGDVTLYDWVPTRVRVHAIADEAAHPRLCDLFPGARLTSRSAMPPKDRACHGRHKPIDVYQMIELSWGDGTEQVASLRRAAPRPSWPTSSGGSATIPTVGRSPRPTAATRWPSPVPPTGWPRRDGADDGKGAENDPETAFRAIALESERSEANA